LTTAPGDWTPLDLTWAQATERWAKRTCPVVIVLDEVVQYGFAVISSPLPGPGAWDVRLRLGQVRGEVRLVTCDPNGQRREPRTDLFPVGDEATVLARIEVPADYDDMGLVIQKRDDGPGCVTIQGVDIRRA
jgi:hypothetical protein